MPADTLAAALGHSVTLGDRVGTENQTWTHFEEGIEIETKVSLNGSVGIWPLSSDISTRIGSDDFPGFVPDVGNEMQRWQFFQHTYEVLTPAAEVGYLAFIAEPAGTYLLKHKRFPVDALRREETFRTHVVVRDQDFDAYLADQYPSYAVRRLGSFARARFDVNLESAATGHFFGIEIDEVTVIGTGEVLRQVELEYHRSRVHEGLDGTTIDGEMARLADLVVAYLQRNGIVAEQTYYSKLSFLRDRLAVTT
jgi:hypothetical protein